MIRALAFVIAACLFAVTAHAAGTITNFDAVGTASNDEITHFDSNGDAINAHAGNGIVVGNYYYMYGEDHSCGFRPGTVSPFCGINVYRYNTAAWNEQPDNLGHVFDPSGFQTDCAAQSGNFTGCYSPHMIIRPSDGKYILWVYAQAATTAKELVFVCTTPGGVADGGTCTAQTTPTFDTTDPLAPAFLVDGGSCYAAYTDLNSVPQYKVKVVALNSTCTDISGASVDTGGVGEGLFFIQHGGTYFVGFGSTGCAYCSSTTVKYRSASSVLGTYGSEATLNATACNGQVRSVDTVTIGGTTSYLYSTDQWQGSSNQGVANAFFVPLTFGTGTINAFTCDTTASLTGPTAGSFRYPTGQTPNQTSMGSEVFRVFCDVGPGPSKVERLQTFTQSGAWTSVALPVGMTNASCTAGGSGCAAPDGNLTVDIVNVTGSPPVPTGAPLKTVTYSPSTDLSWSLKWKTITYAGSAGTYGIRISGTETVGAYCTAFNFTASNPYATGVERYSTDSGTTWTSEATRAIMFGTYVNTYVAGPYSGVPH